MAHLNVKEGYPDKLTNEEIREEIEGLKKYANGGGWKYEITIAANTMIQSGLSTINDRFRKWYSKVLLTLTIISIITAIVSVYFAFIDKNTDQEWQEEQIRQLKAIESGIKQVQ